MVTGRAVLSPGQIARYHEQGYLLAPGLLSAGEVGELIAMAEALHARGSIKGCFTLGTAEEIAGDPLKRYPRMMHPHRIDATAKGCMLHRRVLDLLADLFGEEPLAAQSMWYWKPPGARGQALHQDNFYLRVHPGTCIAAWVAVDAADRENGGLVVAPGSHRLDIFCPEEADLGESFTRHFVPVPQGLDEAPVDMASGDVLFFGGNLIHGSYPNRSAIRFRRSFICHYVGASSEQVARFYKPLFRRDGSEVLLDDAPDGGGPCGEYAPAGPH
ncbi:MAG TPA: phytanoyl-CoA dioxygenase family protein [Chloroflexota bacterium]|jgi:hypothetical protein|nr:phytanoyl-CoA dioxygenase family protein [Chloroflexota bacterium]